MHELNADAAAVDAARSVSHIAGDVQLGMGQRSEVAQRIEICLKVAPAPERVQNALLFFAVNIHHDSGQGSTTPRPRFAVGKPGRYSTLIVIDSVPAGAIHPALKQL